LPAPVGAGISRIGLRPTSSTSASSVAFDTTTGALKARIKVPAGPHGLAIFPQPRRYSLGHTGNYR
jgi:hypothetical protein